MFKKEHKYNLQEANAWLKCPTWSGGWALEIEKIPDGFKLVGKRTVDYHTEVVDGPTIAELNRLTLEQATRRFVLDRVREMQVARGERTYFGRPLQRGAAR